MDIEQEDKYEIGWYFDFYVDEKYESIQGKDDSDCEKIIKEKINNINKGILPNLYFIYPISRQYNNNIIVSKKENKNNDDNFKIYEVYNNNNDEDKLLIENGNAIHNLKEIHDGICNNYNGERNGMLNNVGHNNNHVNSFIFFLQIEYHNHKQNDHQKENRKQYKIQAESNTKKRNHLVIK